MQVVVVVVHALISIHALLAESDRFYPLKTLIILPFLSTLSLRRATIIVYVKGQGTRFLSTLSLRRATEQAPYRAAETQFLSTLSLRRATCRYSACCLVLLYFYPRSPCGERLARLAPRARGYSISIHALLAESDSLLALLICPPPDFYPRSPCGERR